MEFKQVPSFENQPIQESLKPEIKSRIQDAIRISTASPDFGLIAFHLTGDQEQAPHLGQEAMALFEKVIESDPSFVEWAYSENEKLDGAHYPFHDGRQHPYEIALYQSMLLSYFTRPNAPLALLPQNAIDDIIFSGIAHETGLPEGRAGHEARGANKVKEKSPQRPMRSFGVTATTVAFTQIEGENTLVQHAVWSHEEALSQLDTVLEAYNLPKPLTQEQKELLLGIIILPDVKGLILPTTTTETGVIASALENVLTLPGQPLPLDIMKTFDGAVGGTAMLTNGIHASMRKSKIYEQVLKHFKVPGTSSTKMFRFVMENQPVYTDFFSSIQTSIPRIPAPTKENLNATIPAIPTWYPYLENTRQQFATLPAVEESNILVANLYNVMKFTMSFEHLIDNVADHNRTQAERIFQEFLLDISSPALTYSDIEQSYFDHLGQALELEAAYAESV